MIAQKQCPSKGFRRAARAVAILLACLTLSASSQEFAATTHPQRQQVFLSEKGATKPELTTQDLDAFFDGMVPVQMAARNIAGATIIVVKDGKVLFAKGYGYSNTGQRIPVSPDNTLFRAGSISKLFTWTAVMQLAEEGKLDLDRDVNDYLDFRIPPAYGAPITLRRLLTHTAGFEEAAQDLFVSDAAEIAPLGGYLRRHLPRRIFAPGTTPAYSNYGAALAGYIVERVSGESFDSYVEEHIFKPLGMTHSTFRQPLPPALRPLMANGYELGSGCSGKFEYAQAVPAAGATVSAADMARFMLAHLQNGGFDGIQILRSETAVAMHSRQFAVLPLMNGMALGFYEESRNGRRIIGHAGDTHSFHSDLHLMPEEGLGFFYVQNSAGTKGVPLRATIWERFLNRYFPSSSLNAPFAPNGDVHAVTGNYLCSRRSETTIVKISALLTELHVFANADGTISVDAFKDLSGQPKRFRQIGQLLFRNVDGEDRLAFKRDGNGQLSLCIDFPFQIYQKVSRLRSRRVMVPFILTCAATLLVSFLLWPVLALLRRYYGRLLVLDPVRRRLRLVSRLACALDLIYLLVFAIVLSVATVPGSTLSSHWDLLMRLAQIPGWLGVVGTVVILSHAGWLWRKRLGGIWTRVGETLTGLASLGFVWFIFAWNMLCWRLQY